MPAQLPLTRVVARPSYPRRALALAVGAVLGATTLVGCGGGLEAAELQQELMPVDAGQDGGTVTPQPPDLMAGGIAEYPPPLDPDAGL